MRDVHALLPLLYLVVPTIHAWANPLKSSTAFNQRPKNTRTRRGRNNEQQLPQTTILYSTNIDFDSLMDMDVIIFSLSKDDEHCKKQLGAIQEDGSVAPLSVWTEEIVFGDSYLEFLVDDKDRFPGLQASDIVIHSIVPEESLSYGSRQVGGGMGPGNPHGEESEMCYYVSQRVLEGIELSVRPELEIFW